MKKRYRVRITESGRRDIEQIFSYISHDSENNARKFIIELEKLIYSLESYPERNPFIPENELLSTRYRHFIVGDYRVIYRVSGGSVYILRIIHGARLLEL